MNWYLIDDCKYGEFISKLITAFYIFYILSKLYKVKGTINFISHKGTQYPIINENERSEFINDCSKKRDITNT